MELRKLRAFKRWMKWQSIDCSDALDLKLTNSNASFSVSVRALCDLHDGDVVARIPKESCLTIKTSRARQLIEDAGLAGTLGLAVAIMYERSLGPYSLWFDYLQLLPFGEPIPLLWSSQEIDTLLVGTELHKAAKEDKGLVYEDWKQCIRPLLISAPVELKPEFFGVEQYFAAKSLIASRSFAIDDYYGSGMVPLADLFNHKTDDEDVHFTSLSSQDDSDQEVDGGHASNENENENILNDTSAADEFLVGKGAFCGSDLDCSSISGDDPTILLMVMVKDVKAGNEVREKFLSADGNITPQQLTAILVCSKELGSVAELIECPDEDSMVKLTRRLCLARFCSHGGTLYPVVVFNTYGSSGNAALLHRYGFTETNNPYDIVNLDLELVLRWSSSLFSSRHSRRRLSFWRRLDYSGCVSQNSEYFEISFDGEPQLELLVLLYVMLLPEEGYQELDLLMSSVGDHNISLSPSLSQTLNVELLKNSDMNKNLLLTKSVCEALLSLDDIRESLYGSGCLEDDIDALDKCCHIKEPKLYHSLMLRICERRILEKFRSYASCNVDRGTCKQATKRRKKR